MSAKLGRPTDNPRRNKLSIRLNDEDAKALETYCERNKVTKTEAISRGIRKLAEESKEK